MWSSISRKHLLFKGKPPLPSGFQRSEIEDETLLFLNFILKNTMAEMYASGQSGLPPAEPQKNMDRARMGRIVYYILGVIEVLLAFRLVFQLLGASLKSGFVQFIYSLSGVFNLPFSGIFSRATTKGVETVAVFDPSTIIAMIVYAILAWGIVKLLVISAQRPDQVEKGL